MKNEFVKEIIMSRKILSPVVLILALLASIHSTPPFCLD